MSHPPYNPYASGNQSSTQGQYGLSSTEVEMDPWRASSHLGPGPSVSSSGASETPANSRGMLPSLLSQALNYRSEQRKAARDDNKERSQDMHITREEARVPGDQMHQPMDQGTHFTSAQSDGFIPLGTGTASYPMSSTSSSLGYGQSGFESSPSSLEWLSNYKVPTADDPSKFYSSSASSKYVGGGDGRFDTSSEREHSIQAIPGLSNFDYPVPDKPAAPTESGRPKYTSESASNILQRFGLDKEDLEHLVSFPEDQITPTNLPFILRQIRMEKAKRATTAVQSEPCLKPQHTRSVSEMESHHFSSSGGAGIHQEVMSSAVFQPSKVIDYGHTSKYTGGLGDDIGRSSASQTHSGGSGSMLQTDIFHSSRHNREPLQKNATEVKSSAFGSSYDQMSSVSSLSSPYSARLNSVAPPSKDQTKRLQTQLKQTSHTIPSSFCLPKKDTDIRVFKSEAPKPAPLKEPEADRQLTSKSQPPSTSYCVGHPSRPGIVLFDSNNKKGIKDQKKIQGQEPTVAEQMKKQQTQQQPAQQQLKQQTAQQKAKQPIQQMQQQSKQQAHNQPVQQKAKQLIKQMQQQSKQEAKNQPVSQTGQAAWPPIISTAKSVPYASHPPSVIDATQHSVFIPGGPQHIVIPPAVPQPLLSLMNLIPPTLTSPSRKPPAKTAVSKALPTLVMMHDYAATTPKIFPHSCSLCNRECTAMKDWISHQNTTLHLENCKFLRTQYPDWDGGIALGPSAAGKDDQKLRRGSSSRSRSTSPRRRHGSKGRREKSRSCSRSPHSSRYSRRSWSRSRSPRYDRPTTSRYRSHSRSPKRRSDRKRSSSRRRDQRRSSPRRSRERRSSSRGSYQRRGDERPSPSRSSDERKSSPKRRDQRRSPRRKSNKRRSSSRSSDRKRSPSSSSDDRRSQLKTSDKRRSPQRKKLSSAESLAKKLLETPAVQSLSEESDLDSVVKTLAPALIAELAKIKSSPSSSSTPKGDLTPKPSKVKSSPQRVEATSSTKIKSGKSSAPTIVKLIGIYRNIAHSDVISAMEHFGKTKSVVLFRSRLEAVVCFEKEEDAKKLKSLKSIVMKGTPVIVARDKETSPREQKTPHRKPSSSSVSSPQTTTGAKKDTKDKLTDQESAAKGSVKGPSTTIEAKNVSTKQTTEMVKTEKDPKGVVGKQETSTGDNSTVSENQSDVKDSKLKETEVAEAQLKAELRKANDPKDTEPMEIGDIKVEVAEPTDFGSCAEGEGEKQTTTKAEPENSADKSSESRPPDSTDETGPTENAVKALPQSILSEPESTAQGPETKTEASHIQQQAAGSSTEADLEANLADPVTQTDATSAEDASAVTNPTIGEMLEKHLFQSKISCLKMKTCISPKFLSLTQKEHRLKQLLITNLPEYKNGCYTEDDVAKLLVPFGFQYADDNIHVVPQTGMAFILMQKVEDVPKTLKAFNRRKGITFKTSKPRCHAVANGITMTPLGFYKSLMKLIHFPVVDDGSKTVFVKNISWSEAEELRESLRKITQEPVKNYLPLLNKVFIEFESIRDADQFGVWYSLLKQGPDHEVHRLNVLNKLEASESPLESRFPRASIGPFWVTMRTRPFLFPTGDPWFNIPDYLTVRDLDDIEKAGDRGSTFSTVMLTGLPGFGHYKHEDVARLVWQYFPEQSFESLYYNVVVLPLQRRAFVFFSDWAKCCDFVRDHITNPVSVEGCLLSVHFVLEDMKPECSEEMMYKTLMKLSNAGDPEPESLEERLLCVVISETSLDVIRVVIEMVASITTFVSFLPLANRICIEMADSSGVTKVVENYNTFSPDSFKKGAAWSKVKRLEPLKSFKQHLQDSSEITVVFGPNTIYYRPKPPAVRGETQPPPSELSDNESKPALQTSGPGGSTMSKSVTAGPSATVASPSSFIDKAMKDDNEKPGTEITMDSTVARQANKDIEKAEVKVKEGSAATLISTADVTSTSVVSNANTVPTASSSAPSATVTTPEENFAATVHNYSLTQGSRSQSEDEEDPDDVKDNTVSSDAGVFDEKDFNMDDFVTVDEVSDEVGDKSPEHQSSSSSKQSSRARRGRQSSGALTTGKRISTRSVKESKSSSSSPSSSSTKGANSSSSVPPKQSKDSSELSKSPTKPSPPQSSETCSSPSQKTLISKTRPPAKASNTSSSGRSTRSSSAACVTEKITSASSVKASMETCSESAVTKSDQKVSADGLNAKTVESETQKETSSEMHPPLQDHGFELSQAKSPAIDANAINTKDQKKRKEEGNVDDKPTEVKENNSKNYQILDSLDDQTDQQMDDVVQDSSSEAQLSEPKEGQTLHEEIFQVLDSVDDRQDESSEKKMDRSVQVLHQAATGQGDSHLVQDDGSTEKKLSKKDIILAGDKSDWEGKNQETNIVATDCTQEPVHKGDGKRIKEEEVKGEMLSASKDVENPESRIQREDQLHQDPDNKDTLKDIASDAPDQETFKILDSIDDQTETEDVSQNLKKSSDQISKEDIKEDTCPIINSVKDQPTTTKTESETDGGKRNMRGEAMTTKDDSLSKRRGRTTTAPKKQDRTVKQCETRTKMDTTTGDSEKDKEVTEEMVYEIVDYIEDKPVPDAASTEMCGRRRSARGKKEDKVTLNLTEVPEKPEEVTYKILDSVEGETASDELIITRRSTRRKRERTPEKDASAEKTQKVDTPTRRRHTPARESQERNQEKTSKKEEKTSPKKSTSSKKTDNTSEISEEDIASVEREVVMDDQPTVRRKGHRGRPKKDVKSTKEGSTTFKEGDESEKVSDEEEIYQILDSVEDEISDDQPSTAHSKEKISKSNDQQANDRTSVVELTKHEEEEEEEYQIIDSLEDDQAQEELTAAEDKTEDETPTKEEVSTEKVHTLTRGTTGVEASEKVDLKEQTLCQTVDDLEKANDDTSKAEASAIEYNPTTPKSDIKKEKKSTAKAQSDTATPEREKRQKSTEKDDTTSAPEMLYKVSKVDKAQEEELRKQQAAEKEKPFVKVQESRMSEDREQSIRSSSSGGEGGRGTRREKEKTVELDVKELVTLDEVGADEAAEDRAPESREWDSEITEGELQELVTLDEFKEEEEAGKTEQSTVETCPPSQKDESVFFNPETLVALDEAIDDEEEKPDEEQTERTSRSAKRKRDDDTVSDGSINFVTVDKVGEVEEEEEMEAVKTRTRGRAKRTARQTPVRKSVRGKTAAAKNEGDEENEQPGADVQSPTSLDVSSSLDKDSSKLSRHNQLEIQKTEMEEAAASQTNISAASTGKEPENSENKTPEGHMEEGWSTAETKGVSKRRKEPAGPEAKRSRSQSPSVASDVKLPPFKPNNPLGQEFMVPKLGYFCSVCSVFCPHESTAKDLHCSSREHYENLQKYYQKLKQKTSRSTTKSSQGSVSD